MRLVAIHFDRPVVDPVCGRAAEDGSAGPWRKGRIWRRRRADLPGKRAQPTNIHEHSTSPSVVAGAVGAVPTNKAQVSLIWAWLVTAAQPPPVTLESVTETPDEGS